MKRKVQRCIALVMAAVLLTTMAPEVICQAAEGAWEIVMNPETPLDAVYFHYTDSENKTYFYGYIDGKVAVMDENYKLIKKTEFDNINMEGMETIKGVPAFVVSKKEGNKRLTGIVSEKGDTILEPIYTGIYLEDDAIEVYIQEENKYRYGLLDYSCKEILPCEYQRIRSFSKINEKLPVAGWRSDGYCDVVWGGKIILTAQEQSTDLKICADTYKGKTCLCITFDYEYYDNTMVYYYVSFDGELLATRKENYSDGDDESGNTDEKNAYEEVKKKWLDARCDDGKKHVQEFYESKGEKINNIKGTTGYNSKKIKTEDGWQKKVYYYIAIEGTYSQRYWNKDEKQYKYRDQTIYYEYIYNEKEKVLLFGRSFDISVPDDGNIGNSLRQNLFLLRDDGMMCFLNREAEKDAVEELYQVDDTKLAYLTASEEEDLGEHEVFYDYGIIRDTTDDIKMLYDYPNKKLYCYDYECYFGEYCFIKTGSRTEILHRLNEEEGKVSEISYGTIDLSIEEVRNAHMCPLDSDGLIIDDMKNRKAIFVWETKQYTYSYAELGINNFENAYMKTLSYQDGMYMQIEQDENVSYFYMDTNTGIITKLSIASSDDRLIRNTSFDTVQELDGKWYLHYDDGETSIICIDKKKATITVIASNLVFCKNLVESDKGYVIETIDKLVTFNNQLYIQYEIHNYEHHNYVGLMDLSGNKMLDAAKLKINHGDLYIICNDYIIGDGKLYDSSFHEIANEARKSLIREINVDEEGWDSREDLIGIRIDDETSSLSSMIYSSKLSKVIYRCDKNERLSTWRMLSDYYLVKLRSLNSTDYPYKRLLFNSDTGELVYKGYAYVYQDEKNQKIVVFENKKTDAAATPTPSAAATATPKPTSTPSVVRPSGPSTPVTPSSEPTPTVTPSPTATATATPSPTVAPTVAPTATPDITPSPTVEPTEEPEKTAEPIETATVAPTAVPSADVNDNGDTTSNSKKWKVGSKAADKTTNGVYQVTKLGKGRTVSYVRTIRKTSTATIPAAVTLQGKKYKVTAIQKKAFRNNKKLSRVVIGNNITKIGANAFAGCKNLTEIVFGKKVTTISKKAFSDCSKLEYIEIPARVKTIGEKAFYNCKKLKYILVKTNKLARERVGKNVFGNTYITPRVKTDASVWRSYAKIFIQKGGLSNRSVFVIDPVELII